MNDVAVIDRFLIVFANYIDSGFGLLGGEVAFLTATLIVIDITIAGLYWAMSHATGQGDDVIARLIRKVLYVGVFAYIIGNFNWLASIVFRSFAGLGLTASGSPLTQAAFLQPGRLAKTGIDAAAPIMEQIGDMTGFPGVFTNLDVITVLFLAWLVVILSFFILAIQLFITLIEFKLTTLAGFVLVPFALWNKTAFLAEKVLGNVVASGIKVLVLAVIVGIGTGLFAEFQVTPAEPSIDHALVIMLASLSLLALGIFGPGIATGLVSGSPRSRWAQRPPASAVPSRPARAWRPERLAWRSAAHGRWHRPPAARGRLSRQVPPVPAVASEARRPAWATSPGPARSRSGSACPPVRVRCKRAPLPPSIPMFPRAALLPARPLRAVRKARLPTPDNPRGPDACNAASSFPMPPPPSRTRCAVATGAARAAAPACAIHRTHKENLPCDSNDRRCAMPTHRNRRRHTRLPNRYGTSASARPVHRPRTGD